MNSLVLLSFLCLISTGSIISAQAVEESTERQPDQEIYFFPEDFPGKRIIGGVTINTTDSKSSDFCESEAATLHADQWVWNSKSKECLLQNTQCGQTVEDNEDYYSGYMNKRNFFKCSEGDGPQSFDETLTTDSTFTLGLETTMKPGPKHDCYKIVDGKWASFPIGSPQCKN